MSISNPEQEESKTPGWLIGVAVGALVVALGGLGWSLGLQNHLTDADQKLAAANQQNALLEQKIEDTNERLKAQGEALGQSVGLTQKQLEDKSNELVAQQAATARLARDTEQQVGERVPGLRSVDVECAIECAVGIVVHLVNMKLSA